MRLATPHHLRDLVTERTRERPDGIALCAPGRPALTFGALAGQVAATGRRLRELGIGPGDAVALALPSGPDLATAFLGVATHASCVPLNPGHRLEEFTHFLAGTRAKALVVPPGDEGDAVAAARRLGVPTLEMAVRPGDPAGVWTLAGDPVGQPVPDAETRPEDVALTLFTSGTTARPRMVPLTHANLLTAAWNTGRALELTPDDRCLNVMPMFHAHGLTSTLLASFVHGAGIVCPPGFDATAFMDWLDEFRPTWYTAVPAMHTALLDEADHTGRRPGIPLRFIRSASAPLPDSVLARLEKLFDAPVVEGYGLTEAASLVTCNPLPPRPRKVGSVGVPVGGPVGILDPDGRALPPGDAGEIAIRGGNVTAGYAGDPAANEAAFTGGWMRTGDYGYLDADGYLFVIGRAKEIINRGGSKVSPAEVDQALTGHPGLAEVAAFGLPHPTLGEDVAVAVVPRPGIQVDEHSVRAFAARRLIDHKVPSRVFFVDELPRNTTGKVQRVRLTERYTTAARPTPAPPSPVRDTERRIAAIWVAVLDVPEVDPTISFFELGGDSLALARVAERLREETGRAVPKSTLLMYSTVRALAEHLDGTAAEDTAGDADVRRLAAGRERLQARRRRRGPVAGEDR
ncbi:non-ribosomal peptide synthetase [Actinoallomurus sp. NPDC050550]|uniref:non-ribosomal peptide synthetase n=1 Tax=Actinoallomurus sp. NPDC050550 TaxID=3154937 RepID=UPI0033E9D6E5